MGVEPPFLYDHPSKYTFSGPTDRGFNPKAMSQASMRPTPEKSRPQGPLINAKELNRHPDSYFIVPYGQLDWKPMSPYIKKIVKWLRLTQLFLRVCALLGAVGLLICVICIKNTDSTVGWIIRVYPGVAILHTIYAIYHLLRDSKCRTPASSASYMLFAAIMDVGLIPFLVFTAMISHQQYLEPTSASDHWQTLFGDIPDTTKIIYATFLLSVTDGGVHLVSLCLSIYLAIIFRQIAKLPPDMNPLEGNLTSRHKRNKSSLSVASTESTNKDAHLSAPLIDAPRVVPFMHTRTDSSTSVSPQREPKVPDMSQRGSRVPFTHTRTDSANSLVSLQRERKVPDMGQRGSRADLSYHQQSHSPRSSRVNVARAYEQSPYQQSQSPRASRINVARSPEQSSNRTTNYADLQEVFSRPSSFPPLNDDNWEVYPSPSPSPPPAPLIVPPEFQHLRVTRDVPSPQKPKINQTTNQFPNKYANRSPRPLEMNPPTPPITSYNRPNERPLGPSSGNVVWHEDNPGYKQVQNARGKGYGIVADKSRYYGSLYSGKNRPPSTGASIGDRSGVRAREVSGKVAEEGRARMR